ncbi:glycosyltransferase family 2 protein [Lachnoanaerobaculum umeaense]|jgi:glycosyltransferase, group 2 family|uniref:Glycosyltransferase n=1 Tax=Lachnoanaerobaculum umeaense TaxID=617123 RepID=A0A385Q0X2_9FIRM|nr:glycosyltransferase family 2 protein [Lachnoanaerobaculum umeaense]AYA99237.1 glycosyltransferase [Lachnoanaerobaculum umeaense]PZW93168.1 dolichol-phosphate mannosyltransferase [Lachnoanaerobaculum umeaense]
MNKKISIIVSVYNEEEVLFEFYRETIKVLLLIDHSYEIVFVNDGSMDGSRGLLFKIAKDDPNVKVVHFSKNFGHEAAMIAGIDHASGDYLVCMDADLQHPPTLLPEIMKKFEAGYDIINMVRTVNKSAGIVKNITSSAFYKVINRLSDNKLVNNASDFFGISKRVADILRNNYRDKIRFLRGYVQNVGFNTINIEYEAKRRFAGESKYSIRNLFKFSMNTIMTFSNLPLKLGIYAGIMAIVLAIILAIYTVWSFIKVGTPSGYATTICLICFMFSVLFFIVGIIGEYLGMILSELRDHPIYIVEEKINFDKAKKEL